MGERALEQGLFLHYKGTTFSVNIKINPIQKYVNRVFSYFFKTPPNLPPIFSLALQRYSVTVKN